LSDRTDRSDPTDLSPLKIKYPTDPTDRTNQTDLEKEKIMNITPASKQLQAALGCTHEVRITHADLTETTADTDQTLTIAVAAGDLFQCLGMALVTPFEDASDAAFNSTQITVGDGNDADEFLLQTQINENGTEVDYIAGTGDAYAYTAADTVDILIESMAAKSLSDLDAGELVLYVKLVSLADLAASATA
jgi:hypothetical protein